MTSANWTNRFAIGLLCSVALRERWHRSPRPQTLPSATPTTAASRSQRDSARLSPRTVWARGASPGPQPRTAILYVALRDGGVAALRDINGDGRFEMKEKFRRRQCHWHRSAERISLHRHASNTVERYKVTSPGQLKPTGASEVVVKDLPGESEHGDKGLTFDGRGSLYVNVGAPSNGCQVKDRGVRSPGQDPCPLLEKHGGIWKFDENKLGQTQADGSRFATGLRQMPALTWFRDALYIVMNNRDQLDVLGPGKFTAQENAERPAEPLYRALAGSNFGWPYCFYDYGQKKFLLNPEYGGDGKAVGRCAQFTAPAAAFPAHWAPVDVAFYTGRQFPVKYRDGAFIAFHGSWNRAPLPQAGYNVTFQPFAGGKPSGNYEIFASGFPGKMPLMNPEMEAVARPDGVTQAPDGSLFIGDSQKGRIWRVLYRGDAK